MTAGVLPDLLAPTGARRILVEGFMSNFLEAGFQSAFPKFYPKKFFTSMKMSEARKQRRLPIISPRPEFCSAFYEESAVDPAYAGADNRNFSIPRKLNGRSFHPRRLRNVAPHDLQVMEFFGGHVTSRKALMNSAAT